MRSKDFKEKALNALRGNWGIAILASLIASALGASDGSVSFGGSIGGGGSSSGGSDAMMPEELVSIIVGVGIAIILFSIAISVALLVVSGPVWVGYSKFNLDLIDDSKSKNIGTLFSGFKILKTAFLAKLLQNLYVFLWSLLFVIPGIVASYKYAMAGYILAENPHMSAKEALEQSKRIMDGNKLRLFSLDMSFIGWHLLCILTFGIGYVWLAPYIEASHAAFYCDLTRFDRKIDNEYTGFKENDDNSESSLVEKVINPEMF